MTDKGLVRRDFLKGAVVGGAAAATAAPAILPDTAQAQQPAAAPAPAAAGYSYLNVEEAAFVEALVDHMVPADNLSPSGTDIGINIFIDRALAGAWGKGDRLYMQGPWKRGAPSQGYQLPLTPAQLYRAGIAATNGYCRKQHQKSFDQLDETQRIGTQVVDERGLGFDVLLVHVELFLDDPLHFGRDVATFRHDSSYLFPRAPLHHRVARLHSFLGNPCDYSHLHVHAPVHAQGVSGDI